MYDEDEASTMKQEICGKTIELSYLKQWEKWIGEYELILAKKHPKFQKVTDFYKHYEIKRQTFHKRYKAYLEAGSIEGVLPKSRGPRYKKRQPNRRFDEVVIRARLEGMNKYDIYGILKESDPEKAVSPSTIYRTAKRLGVNRLKPKAIQQRRTIIKERAGEMGHVDCHYLRKDLITGDSHRYYLVCVMDACTRVAWAEVVEDVKSLTVMFATLKSLNLIKQAYSIQFEELLTDNGPEFASPNKKEGHPFERMLLELGVKHRYTRPRRPQTNGKVERFWRTLNEELIDGADFESIQHFKQELIEYLGYYNEVRPHQALQGITPLQFLKKNKQQSVNEINEHVQG